MISKKLQRLLERSDGSALILRHATGTEISRGIGANTFSRASSQWSGNHLGIPVGAPTGTPSFQGKRTCRNLAGALNIAGSSKSAGTSLTYIGNGWWQVLFTASTDYLWLLSGGLATNTYADHIASCEFKSAETTKIRFGDPNIAMTEFTVTANAKRYATSTMKSVQGWGGWLGIYPGVGINNTVMYFRYIQYEMANGNTAPSEYFPDTLMHFMDYENPNTVSNGIVTDMQYRRVTNTAPTLNFFTPFNYGSASLPVITSGQAAPDGTLTAYRVQMTLNGATGDVNSGCGFAQSGNPGKQRRVLWVKSNDGGSYNVGMRYGFSIAADTMAVTPTWKRFASSHDIPSIYAYMIGVYLRGACGTANTVDVTIWNPQENNVLNLTDPPAEFTPYAVDTTFDYANPTTVDGSNIVSESATRTSLPQPAKLTPILGAEKLSTAARQMDTGHGWTSSTGATISGGVCTMNHTATTGIYANTMGLEVGKIYQIQYTITSMVKGIFEPQVGYTKGQQRTTAGTYTDILVCTTDTYMRWYTVGATNLVLDNVSIKEVTNNKGVLGSGWLSEPASTNKCTCYGVPRLDAEVELLTVTADRDFSSDTGYWTHGADWTITGGKAVSNGSGTWSYFYRIPTLLTVGKFYKVSIVITDYVSGGLAVYLGNSGGNNIGTINANGTYNFSGMATGPAAGGVQFCLITWSTFSGAIDSISIKECPDGVGTKSYMSGNLLGSQLLTTAQQQCDSGWAFQAGWSQGSGILSATAASAAAYQTNLVTAEKRYQVIYTVTLVSGTIQARAGWGGLGTVRNASGTYTESITAASDTYLYFLGAAFTGSIDNISLKEVLFDNNISGMTLLGNPATTLSIVTDQTELENAKLSHLTNGYKVYELNVPAGTLSYVLFSGLMGNTNIHTPSIYGRYVSGNSASVTFPGLSSGGTGAISSTLTAQYRKLITTYTACSQNTYCGVFAYSQGVYRFFLPQLEEMPFATSLMPTVGATASRITTLETIPLSGNMWSTAVLGSELITVAANRDFSSDTGFWLKQSWTIANGKASHVAGANDSIYNNNIPGIAAGKQYEFVFTLRDYVAGNVAVALDGVTVPRTANGTYSLRRVSPGTWFYLSGSADFVGSVDDISIKEILAINVTQPTVITQYWTPQGFGTAGQLQYIWSSRIDANNYTALWFNGVILCLQKVVAGVSEYVCFPITVVIGVTYKLDALIYTDGTLGLLVDGVSAGSGYGYNLVANGTFDTDTTGWGVYTAGTTLAVVGGKVQVTCPAGYGYGMANQYLAAVQNRLYTFTGNFTAGTASFYRIGLGTSITAVSQSAASWNLVGFYTGSTWLGIGHEGASAGQTILFDNIVVREILNSTTTATKPIFGTTLEIGSFNGGTLNTFALMGETRITQSTIIGKAGVQGYLNRQSPGSGSVATGGSQYMIGAPVSGAANNDAAAVVYYTEFSKDGGPWTLWAIGARNPTFFQATYGGAGTYNFRMCGMVPGRYERSDWVYISGGPIVFL